MAKLKSTGGEHLAVWDGQRWISIKGEKGDPGTSLTVKGTKPTPADLPATSTAGEAWIVAGAMYVFDGTAWNNIGNVTGPKGDPGSAGPKGDAGVAGAAGKDGTSATVRVGAVAEGPVAVTNTGTNAAAVLNFTIPKGDPGSAGPKGDAGATPAISIGTTTTLATGSPATVTQTGTTLAPVLSFGIPTGPKGDAGAAGTPGVAGKDGTNGTAATVTVGTVKTLAAGQPVTVVNSGTTSAAVLDISIPQGSQGIQGVAGADGKAATVALGTVTQGTTLGVTNSGTSSAAVFNFTLVKGDKGDTGAAGKDGSGVTITGTQNGGTWPPTSPYTKGDMILIGTPVPTGVPAGTLTGHGMVHDGVAWANVGSIQGPAGPKGDKGDAGPQAVSADANNYSRLGTDSKIFTPTPTIPAAAVANPLTDGTAAPGVSLKYAREDHVHPLPTLTALGAAAATHTHPATAVTGLAAVATSGKYSDLTGAPAAFTLPEASATVLGGIKVGTGLSIATGGVLSATAQSPVDATTTVKGVVMLADATAITAGTTGKIPDAGQLKAQVDPKAPKASPAFTGTVQIPAGTAAAPSLVFTGDMDTGVFAPSANSVGLSAGGVSAVEATATGVTLHGTLTAGGLKYPATKGTKDQVLASDGAGNVEWHTVTAGTSYTLPAATALALGGVKVADPAAVTLGAAGYVVDAAQLKALADARVKLSGDTMTGALSATTLEATAGRSSFTPVNEPYAIGVRYSAAGLPNYIGTASTGEFQVSSAGGVSMMQVGTTGNITSPGTAHSFVAGSIARSAVAGIAETDLDTRYVNTTGDTMTGVLTVKPTVGPAAPDGSVHIIGDGTNANLTVQRNQDSGQPVLVFKKSRGTTAAPTAVHSGDTLSTFQSRGYGAAGTYITAGFINVACTRAPAAADTGIPAEMRFSVHDGAASKQVMVLSPTGVGATDVTATSVTAANFTATNTVTATNITAANTVTATNITATGTAKTVALEVSSASTLSGRLIVKPTAGVAVTVEATSPGATSQATGMVVNILPVASKTSRGIAIDNKGSGTDANYGLTIDSLPVGANNYALFIQAPASNYFAGNVGIGWQTPTHPLEVNGATMLRGTLDVTGNIASTGTTHSFVAKSIPASAIGDFATIKATGGRSVFAPLSEAFAIGVQYNASGAPNYIGTNSTGDFQISNAGGVSLLNIGTTGNLTTTGTAHTFAAKSIQGSAVDGATFAAKSIPVAAIDGGAGITGPKTIASQTATGVAGEMCWDVNYLYLAIGANTWRRVPLMAWDGSGASGSGAGAADTALPATMTNSTANVINAGMSITPVGAIIMGSGTTVPELATGIKIQYRVHGGNWIDATIASYLTRTGTAGYASRSSFQDLKTSLTGGTTQAYYVISGPPPNVPYITRMAWVSSLGVGVWGPEIAAVTPTA